MAGEPRLCDPKPLWRRHYRQRRGDQPSAQRRQLLEQALAGVPPLIPADRRLGLYWPLTGEADLRELAAELPTQLALPAIRAMSGKRSLCYEAWRPADPLQPDAAGVPAPAAASTPLPAEALGLLLVPALALDRRGFRLGYGGGWFDRLRADPPWRSVPALIVAPFSCVVERLPVEPWDVPFDGWLSEKGIEWLQPVERPGL
ncbi:5-formyltetrahydrofolate cyclo-ligase [Synechococcus sp. CS-205]|uniref:5-formyltetrahydrofolate cyclo-ligase n=1 Tax=Synechococcus sp. CS-205 TaxID=2847984 RepID=UPI00223B592D|nr:5-formyltetrahydrofolate cyclo-ligase [Synechococcus sp. CS-205]MCT0247425.1 5-formyltetrahydrofolate cyclo-ligase [Synechococcus sp. CS-205]